MSPGILLLGGGSSGIGAETDPVAEADLNAHKALKVGVHGLPASPTSGHGVLWDGTNWVDTDLATQVELDAHAALTTSAHGGPHTFRLPILNWATAPDITGDCYPETFDILATNDVWKRFVFRFGANNAAQPTVKGGIFGGFAVPKSYVSAANLIIVWTSTITSGDVVWSFDYRTVGGDDTTSLDQSGTEQSATVADTAPGAALRRMVATIDLTDANFSPDEEVEFLLARDGTAGGDTLAGSAILFNALFEYQDA